MNSGACDNKNNIYTWSCSGPFKIKFIWALAYQSSRRSILWYSDWPPINAKIIGTEKNFRLPVNWNLLISFSCQQAIHLSACVYRETRLYENACRNRCVTQFAVIKIAIVCRQPCFRPHVNTTEFGYHLLNLIKICFNCRTTNNCRTVRKNVKIIMYNIIK